MTTAQTGEHVTVSEAATLLGVHQNTIRNRIKSGHIPAEKVLTPYGEAFAIPRAHIEEALQSPPYRPLPNPSQVVGRVLGGSNGLVSPNDGQNGEVGRGDGTLATPTSVTLTTIVREVVAPLTALTERQADELAALHVALRDQAEELGRERGRREAAEQDAERLRRAHRSRPWWVRLFLTGP